MKILAIEASGKVAGCALLEGGASPEEDVLLGEFSLQTGLTHSETLMPMMEKLLDSLHIDIHSVDCLALTGGPGSFTGLRIGAAAVKGLAFALDVPIIPLSTTESLAANLYMYEGDIICPVMDARRGQVYTGLYTYEDGKLKTLAGHRAMPLDEILDIIDGLFLREDGEGPLADDPVKSAVIFLGDGVPVYRDRIRQHFKDTGISCLFAPAHLSRQRAAVSASLAMMKYREQKEEAFVSAEAFRPEYLRLSQAERERNAALMNLNIRRMEKSDVEAALRVEEACFSEPWTGEMFNMTLLLPYARYYVAETPDGKVVGICGLKILTDTGEITNVGVIPEFRGKQIGRRMLERLLDDGAAEGVFSYTLEVRESNIPAVSLYEKLGFKTEGVRKGFYAKPREDALIMWRRV